MLIHEIAPVSAAPTYAPGKGSPFAGQREACFWFHHLYSGNRKSTASPCPFSEARCVMEPERCGACRISLNSRFRQGSESRQLDGDKTVTDTICNTWLLHFLPCKMNVASLARRHALSECFQLRRVPRSPARALEPRITGSKRCE